METHFNAKAHHGSRSDGRRRPLGACEDQSQRRKVMSFENLIYDVVDQVAVLKVNRPQALNALDANTLKEVRAVIKDVDRNVEIRSLVITGEGDRSFVSGADISQMCDCDPAEILEFSKQGHKTLNMLQRLPKPVLAAVNGYALGGGMELALACDMIFASDRAKFGQPEVKLGIIPGFGGTQRLARLVGPNLAKEFIFSGAIIDAERAKEMGLVNEIVPHESLYTHVIECASRMNKVGALAIAEAKKVINDGLDRTLDEGNDLEMSTFSGLFGTQDQKEGMRAFLEKREPDFTGKVTGHLLLS